MQREFAILKAEVEKRDINKLVNVFSGFNNFQTKVYDIDIDKLKTVPVHLKNVVM